MKFTECHIGNACDYGPRHGIPPPVVKNFSDDPEGRACANIDFNFCCSFKLKVDLFQVVRRDGIKLDVTIYLYINAMSHYTLIMC